MAIKRGRVETIEDFERQFEKKENEGTTYYPYRVGYKGNNSLVVRFLTEPNGWVWYQQYWNPALNGGKGGTVIATEENEDEYAERNIRPSTVYLAPAVLVENQRIIVVELRWSLADAVKAVRDKYEDKFGPLTAYDVELKKEGEGKDGTKYRAFFDDKTDVDVSRYEIPNGHKTWQDFLWSVVEQLDSNSHAATPSLPDDTDLGEDNANGDEPKTVRRVVKRAKVDA